MPQVNTLAEHQRLVTALRDPRRYPHAVDTVELVETHISSVLLAGDFAYKLKKPVNFGFIDFSTPARRTHFCAEELRLNRRLAPDLYLDTVDIGGDLDAPELGARNGFETAVRMRRFDQAGLLSRLAAEHRLEAAHIDALAAQIGDFHTRIAVAGADTSWGEPDAVMQPVRGNFAQIEPRLRDPDALARLARLKDWAETEWRRLTPLIAARKHAGRVREGHGDLHLGNIALIDGAVTVFDGIEFNPGLIWIDVISEIAFLVMDLQDRGHPRLAQRFLNAWLERSGDYAALALLRFYLGYRALVRAKIARLRLDQLDEPAARAASEREYAGYVTLAERSMSIPPPALLITHGLSGCGKSWIAQQLAERAGLIRVRADVERKRLFGLPLDARDGAERGLYTADASERTFTRLAEIAADLIRAGHRPIVDATFLGGGRRAQFRDLAAELGVPFVMVACEAPEAVLMARVGARHAAGSDVSEAGPEVLRDQLAHHQPLSAAERAAALVVDGVNPDVDAAVALLNARLAGS